MTHDIKNWKSICEYGQDRIYMNGDDNTNAIVFFSQNPAHKEWWSYSIAINGVVTRIGYCKNECDAMQVCEVLLDLPYQEAC